ncbi:MAG TPA: KUP/HAK/KT family potassium transporter, partial [Alphaproteobacteria bacterium]|nr:KUP/HAK/KT family potassium transporter [Alphaproteobacteria bacterium]
GAEALYADLGHFGRRPIQVSWNWIVFPALCLNYLGQGALLLKTPEAISHPFYHLAPSWALHGMIIFSTIATIIASQAVLSGLFSVVSQSTLLNYLPRMRIVNTSREHIGQVYAPALNFILFIFTTLAVLLFKNSENLAAAYGLCVAAIMLITSFLIFVMVSKKYTWSLVIRLIVFIPIFSIDMLFVITNAMKFKEGAWFAVLLSLGVFVIITTWVKGNKALQSQKINIHDPIKEFIEDHKKDYPTAIPGISLFLCRQPYKIPSALMMQLHHNKFLHEVVIFVSIVIKEKPVVKKTEHFEFETITNNCYQVVANYGFKENPNLYKVIEWLAHNKKIPNPQNVSIFLGRGIPVSSNYHNLSKFSQKLYILLASLSQNPTDFYKIPDQQVIELGLRYKL